MLSRGHCAYSVLIVSDRLVNQSDGFSLALHKKTQKVKEESNPIYCLSLVALKVQKRTLKSKQTNKKKQTKI